MQKFLNIACMCFVVVWITVVLFLCFQVNDLKRAVASLKVSAIPKCTAMKDPGLVKSLDKANREIIFALGVDNRVYWASVPKPVKKGWFGE